MKPAVRTSLLNAHLWPGPITGVVLFAAARSGAVLMVRPKFGAESPVVVRHGIPDTVAAQ